MSEQKIVCFDATELDNFEMCSFRWHTFHHLNIKPKYTESYFEKGTLLHYFLERYYTQKREKEIDIENIIELGRIKSLEFNITLEELSETIFQFREYCRFYEEENIVPLHIEEPFMKEIFEDEEIKVLISGKPDLIFKYNNSPSVCVMDHKRMSRNFDYSPLRNQFLLYATAMETDTVIINKVGFQKTKSAKDRFLRTPFIFPQEILEEWKHDIIQRAREMVVCEEYNHYQRNRTSCEKWSGCYLQRYCITRPAAREFLIGSEYIIGKSWDVGKKLE